MMVSENQAECNVSLTYGKFCRVNMSIHEFRLEKRVNVPSAGLILILLT